MKHSPAFLKIVEETRSRITEIDAGELPARLRSEPDAVVIDVREDREWEAGHLRGAIHLGKGVIERDIEQAVPDPATPLYLYCGGGFRSVLAADNLRRMGYSRAASVDGGWRRLRELMPTE